MGTGRSCFYQAESQQVRKRVKEARTSLADDVRASFYGSYHVKNQRKISTPLGNIFSIFAAHVHRLILPPGLYKPHPPHSETESAKKERISSGGTVSKSTNDVLGSRTLFAPLSRQTCSTFANIRMHGLQRNVWNTARYPPNGSPLHPASETGHKSDSW